MKVLKLIKTKAAIAAVAISTAVGAFLMPVQAFASDGNGAVWTEIPQGWQNHEYTAQVKVEDYVIWDKDNNEIPVTYKSVEYAIDDGKYVDITDTMVVTIDKNCHLKLRAIYEDGGCAFNECDIENFDLERPTIDARLDGEMMYLTAADEISGVKKITVNGQDYTDLKDGQMCTCIKDYEQTDEYIEISSTDVAGNVSKGFKIKNPYFVGEVQSGQEDKSLDNPDSVEPTDPTKARGTVTDDFVTNEREFFTVDASGKTFYLIVDRSQSTENVYLLTEAGCNDLLNFTDYNGVDVQNGDVPMYEIPSNRIEKVESKPETEETEEEPTEEPKEENKTGSPSWLVIILIAAVFGGGYYFIKVKKTKEDLMDADEMDEFDNEGAIDVDDSEEDEFYDDEDDYDEEDENGADITPEALIEDEIDMDGSDEIDDIEYVDLSGDESNEE